MSVANNAVMYVHPRLLWTTLPCSRGKVESSGALHSHSPFFFPWSAMKRTSEREMQWSCSLSLPGNGEKRMEKRHAQGRGSTTNQ